MELDRTLISDARRFITGANVHYINTWIYCYEMSDPGSPRSARYEALLRDFVFWKQVLDKLRDRVETQKTRINGLSGVTTSINRRIERLRTVSSE